MTNNSSHNSSWGTSTGTSLNWEKPISFGGGSFFDSSNTSDKIKPEISLEKAVEILRAHFNNKDTIKQDGGGMPITLDTITQLFSQYYYDTLQKGGSSNEVNSNTQQSINNTGYSLDLNSPTVGGLASVGSYNKCDTSIIHSGLNNVLSETTSSQTGGDFESSVSGAFNGSESSLDYDVTKTDFSCKQPSWESDCK